MDASYSAACHNLRPLGRSDLGGFGDGMQVMLHGDVAYVGHLGLHGTSVVDVSDPRRPAVKGHLPAPAGTHCHKVQTGNGLLLVNRERFRDAPHWAAGVAIYDISEPLRPRQVGEWRTEGAGVHRMWFTDESPLAFISSTMPGFSDRILVVLDLSRPDRPAVVGRWWLPGMHTAGGEQRHGRPGRRCVCHHPIVRGDRAYVSWWDLGMVILDVSDPAHPALVAHLDWYDEGGGATHTVLPLGRWLAVADEAIVPAPERPEKRIRLIDAADERHPSLHAVFPLPAAADEQRTPGLRFGPHNLHENRPGTYRAEDRIVATYYAGGLRAYELDGQGNVRERAWLVPAPPAGQNACQTNDLLVRPDGLVLFTDRLQGGLYTAVLN